MITNKSITIIIPEDKINDIKLLVNEFGKEGMKPLVWAINKTMTGSATGGGTGGMIKKSVDRLAEYINMQKTTLKEGPHTPGFKPSKAKQIWKVEKATIDNLSGSITCTSANIPLIFYSNQRGARKEFAKAITVQVLKARGSVRLKHAFVPQLPSGHRGVFVRVKNSFYSGYVKSRKTGKDRIKELYGARISDFFSNPEMLDDTIVADANDMLDEHLNHEIDYFLGKHYKGVN